ncbi:MAG: tyrosine-type recombinase/integrase [Bacillota bacterium]
MEFYGINACFLKQYIEFKRNMGYEFRSISNLKTFDRFTVKNEVSVIGLTRDLSKKWAKKRPNESDVTRYKRVNDIKNFSIYLNQIGYKSYIPRQLKSYHTTFTPHIFSKKELNSFFKACDTIEVKKQSTMKYILPVLFRMLYGCGLRINEALSLKCKDVNLNEGYITIRKPKNGQDRMLPLSKSLIEVCIQYNNNFPIKQNDEDYFFIQLNSSRYASNTIYRWFRRILWKAGIPHGGKGKGPRVHDLRQSFSVHSLVEMSRKGLDLYYSLPILSKYLGHNSLEATDKYVRLTAEMYPELIEEVNALCSYVFPEVKLS